MHYTEDFGMHHYARFSQIGSHIIILIPRRNPTSLFLCHSNSCSSITRLQGTTGSWWVKKADRYEQKLIVAGRM